MTEALKHLEGQTVNGEFHLRKYLGGSERGAVFQTSNYDRDPQAAAIKLIAENSPNADGRLASWQLASNLSHPNLIQIFQTGRCQIGDAKFLYVVMKYAEEDLSQIVLQRPLTENEAGEMLKPALDALAYLHAKGVVHGRIKPANIMASGDQLKLSTDGLRRVGTPFSDTGDYDPPESTSSPAGDMWSLGMTLVEVLTQRLPRWDRNGQGDPEVSETLPPPLLDIARHCLRRDPKLRWKVADIANRLNPSTPAPLAEQSIKRNTSPKRSRYLIPAVVLFLLLASFARLKLLDRTRRSDTRVSPGGGNSSQKTPPEPQQAGRAALPDKIPTTPSDTQNSSSTSPTDAFAPLAASPTTPGAGADASGVVHQALPEVPQTARDTIRGTVRVVIKVTVDPSGNVTDATIDSPGPSQYFANLALKAAPQWKFASAGDGSSNWTLRFEFSADGAKAFAKQIN